MDRTEVIGSFTIAELAQLPTAVREHIDHERVIAVNTARTEAEQGVTRQLAEAVGLPAETSLTRIIGVVAEMQAEKTKAEAERKQREVSEHIDTKLTALVGNDASGEGVERARKQVRRLVTAEMKEQSVNEAERALQLVLGDAETKFMIDALIKAGMPPTTTPPAAQANVETAAEMVGTQQPPTVAPVNVARAEGRDGVRKSAFIRTTIQGPGSGAGSLTGGLTSVAADQG